MNYNYCKRETFEDFACGRVIYHRSGMPSFPAKLAGEIFGRCLEYLGKKEGVSLYDPCCGGAYMLTVLGFLYSNVIGEIFASDISEEAILLAQSNLSLLTEEGILKRKNSIHKMIDKYGKSSHKEALSSIEVFSNIIINRQFKPQIKCFKSDNLDRKDTHDLEFKSDIVIADVPYGNLVSWQNSTSDAVNVMLDNLVAVLHEDSIVAVITDKTQKINNKGFKRLEKFKVGKRQVIILKLNGEEE